VQSYGVDILQLTASLSREPGERFGRVPAECRIPTGEDLPETALDDGWREDGFPGAESGKGLIIPRKRAMKKRGAAPGDARYEKRFADLLSPVAGKKNLIQQEPQPVCELKEQETGETDQQKEQSP